jgi:hypothetical protein
MSRRNVDFDEKEAAILEHVFEESKMEKKRVITFDELKNIVNASLCEAFFLVMFGLIIVFLILWVRITVKVLFKNILLLALILVK